MKLKHECLALVFIGLLLLNHSAKAIVFSDQVPTVQPEAEDENPDAVSRFGENSEHKKNKKVSDLALQPIGDASFDSSPGRGPAEVKPVKIKSSDVAQSKKLIVNQANRDKAVQEVAVIANDTGFYPKTIFLTQGIPARIFITGASAKSQCFMLDQFSVRRQIRSQKIEEVTFVPEEAGIFTFNCPMNGAKGSIIVKELEIPLRVPAAVSANE